MALAATDIIVYLAANQPADDTSTSGGAIDATVRLATTAFDSINSGSGDRIDLVSASAGDTQNVSLAGYGTHGEWIEETVALDGTGHKQSVATFKHLCKCVAASNVAGAVTIARYNTGSPVTLATIVAGEKGYSRLFLKAVANAAGGAAKEHYCKVFVKNTNGSSGAVFCKFWNAADGSAQLTFALEMSGSAVVTGGSETTTNRLTKPTTGGTYTFVEAASAGAALTMGDAGDGNLIAGEAQGVWVCLTLAAGASPSQVATMTLESDVAAS